MQDLPGSMVRRREMSSANGLGQRDAVLFGLAGGMLVVSAALAGGYYVISTRSEARAATRPPVETVDKKDANDKTAKSTPPAKNGAALDAFLLRAVQVKTGGGIAKKTWADLGVEIDPDELARTGEVATEQQLTALAAKGSIPVRIDRDKAIKAVLQLKGQYDQAAIDAHLDLEARKVMPDSPGQGIDVWGSLQKIASAARQGVPQFEVVTVPVPARMTKEVLGIDDISHVMG